MNPTDIPGWMFPNELDWLTKTAKDKSLIIEIGTWKGRSTAALCNGCLNGKVISIDDYSGSTIDPINFKELKEGVNVEAIARENLKEYLESGKLFMTREIPLIYHTADMVFIDGDHEYGHVKSDIRLALDAFLKDTGALICGHDIHLASVATAVIDFFSYSWRRVQGTTIWYKEL